MRTGTITLCFPTGLHSKLPTKRTNAETGHNERLYVVISLTTSFVFHCSDTVAVPLLFDRQHLFQGTKTIRDRLERGSGEPEVLGWRK